jgi:hypothetical protein
MIFKFDSYRNVPAALSLPNKVKLHLFLSSRVRATNTQLGQEENSNYIQLSVDTTQTTDVPPTIVVPPQDVVVVRQSPVTELQCIANARPLYELEMIWLKDGRLIEESGVPYSFNDLWNRTLSLLSVDFVHEGTYTCAVRMRTGGPVLRESAKVRVIGKSAVFFFLPSRVFCIGGRGATVHSVHFPSPS